MGDILKNVILDKLVHVKVNEDIKRNILTLGYTTKKESLGTDDVDLNQYCLNTTNSIFNSFEWITLHNRIGDKLMTFMLHHCFIFIPLPKKNYLQICGYEIDWAKEVDLLQFMRSKGIKRAYLGLKRPNKPTRVAKIWSRIELIRSQRNKVYLDQGKRKKRTHCEITSIDEYSSIVNKRRHLQSTQPEESKKRRLSIWRRRKAKKGSIPNSMIMEHKNTEKKIVTVVKQQGILGQNHVIPAIKQGASSDYNNQSFKEATPSSEDNKHPLIVRNKAFFVDPLSSNIGLSRLTLLWKLDPNRMDAYNLTSSIFNLKPRKRIPKRYNTFIDHALMIIAKSKKCTFDILLKHYCPLKKKREQCDEIKWMILCVSTYSQVSQFIYAICKSILPFAVLGSIENWKRLKQCIKLFVRMRRNEKIDSHYLLKGYKLNDIEWLSVKSKGHKPPSDHVKRKEMLTLFITWLFDDFICSLLSNNFYITDSSKNSMSMSYYQRSIWKTLHIRTLLNLGASDILRNIDNNEAKNILKGRSFGFSTLRFIPRSKDFRFIVNMSQKSCGLNPNHVSSINSELKKIKHVIQYEITQRDILGFSVMSTDTVYSKLLHFKSNLPPNSKLYIVKTDISKAYDSILHHKLLDIIENTFTLEKYLLLTYTKTNMDFGKCIHKWVKCAMNPSDFPQFLELANTLSGKMQNTILADSVRHHLINRRDIIYMIREHIARNIIKDRNNFYLQMCGIPQGSCISSYLCCLYYGDMEKMYFSPFTSNEDNHSSLMLRWIDDLLYITTDESKARKLLNLIYEGIPEYNVEWSLSKTKVNFDLDSVDKKVSRCINKGMHTYVPWCGWLINVHTLEVIRQFPKLTHNSLYQRYTSHPGDALYLKLLRFLQLAVHPVLLDRMFNSLQTVCINTATLFMNMGTRFVLHKLDLSNASSSSSKKPNDTFILNTVYNTIQYFCTLLDKMVLKYNLKHVVLSPEEAMYLGISSYLLVFKKYQTRYENIIHNLERSLHILRGKCTHLRTPLLVSSTAYAARLVFKRPQKKKYT